MKEKIIWTEYLPKSRKLKANVTIFQHMFQKLKLFKIVIFASVILLGCNLYAQENIVKTFSGSGGKNTRPFSVNKGWEIQWDAKGDIFQLYLYNADGDMIGVPANQQGSGQGSSYQPKGGKYYLQVNAIGNWTIKIVQISSSNDINKQSVKEKEDEKYIESFSGSGGKNTRPFTVPSGWEIQWNAKGDIFQIYLYKADGSLVGVPANQQGAGTGNSYQAKGGKYYLQVNAIGDWTVKIVKVK